MAIVNDRIELLALLPDMTLLPPGVAAQVNVAAEPRILPEMVAWFAMCK
jgi:hypothetical protein